MAIQAVRTPYDKLAASTGGGEIIISEAVEGGWSGLSTLGNVREIKYDQQVETVKVPVSADGLEVTHREITTTVGLTCSGKLTETNSETIRRLFLTTDETSEALNAAATADAETCIAGRAGQYHGLDNGTLNSTQRGNLTVYNVTDSADLVAGTDYSVVVSNGQTYIKLLVDTHAGDEIRIGTGATASSDYEYEQPARRAYTPLSDPVITVRGKVMLNSQNGISVEHRFESASLRLSNFTRTAKEAGSCDVTITFERDGNNTAEPFGKVYEYGAKSEGGIAGQASS